MLLAEEVAFRKLLSSYRLMNKAFQREKTILVIGGFFVGYYLANVGILVKEALETEEIISAECPLCKTENFQLMCSSCKKVLSCHECYEKGKLSKCSQCSANLEEHEPIHVYLA